MKTVHSLARKRSLAAVGAGAALLVALTGCQSGTADTAQESSTAQQTTTAPQDQATASPSTAATDGAPSESSTTASQESGSGGGAGKAAGTPGKMTPPGTQLKFGDVAYTHSNSGDKGTAKYKEATYETTVTKIVPGSEADLSKFKDAAKFAGQVPYYVFTDIKLTSLNRPSAGISDPRITGLLKDGSEAQKLIVFGSMDKCESTNFKTEGKDDSFTYVVGSTKTACSVFLAPKGDAVTSASYGDSSFNYEKSSDNEYRDKPIVWTK